MSNPINRLLFLPLLLFLISASVFQPKWLVLGSPVHERTLRRPDPLRHLKNYNGQFDVRNKHYIDSTAFTGVHGYAIALVWLLCGLALGIFLIVRCLGSGSALLPFKDFLDPHNILIFSLILFFTFLAIIASSFVLSTNQKTQRRTETLKETVVGIGGGAYNNITKVIRAMKEMQYLLLPYNQKISTNLNSTIGTLRTGSRVLRRFVARTGHYVHEATRAWYVAHVVLVTINLVMLIAALVSLLLHWRPGFITLIFCCWFLTSLCWVLTGLNFFLHTFADDACSAIVDLEQNPKDSSLTSMLPCLNESESGKLLSDVGYTVHNFIVELNSNVSVIYRFLGVDGESVDLVSIIKICDPFSQAPNYTYNPQSCSDDAIQISELPRILAEVTCHRNEKVEKCRKEGKFLSQASYNMAHAYGRSIQNLLDIYPELESLSRCTFVKNGFSDILIHQCEPIRASTKLMWSFMLTLSIVMVFLELAWLADAFLCWGKSISIGSRRPQSQN
ncbi:hypothetical protein L6164_027922 [Bauhinia variegata]|uniref:Uncharacterized protein n=1 Tax=Bauhinia variegata TaxID=167791 RepID=A0ACB9LUM5_BAUVA|nr:hypothetical protein L6164_027922 [Bauhinia variegata]